LITAAGCGSERRRSRLAEGHRRRRREAALTAEHDVARSNVNEMKEKNLNEGDQKGLTRNTVDQQCTSFSAFTRVFDALLRCTASGTRGLFPASASTAFS